MSVSNLSVLAGGAVALALLASASDLRTRRIPNALTLGGAVLGIVAQGIFNGPGGLLIGVLGWSIGLVLLLPLYALRGMGGGDVKFLAALGAWTGARLVVWTALYGAIAGGVLAIAVALWAGVLRQTLANIGLLTAQWRVAGIGPVQGLTLESSRGPKLPYAIPLTCGLLVALWLKG